MFLTYFQWVGVSFFLIEIVIIICIFYRYEYAEHEIDKYDKAYNEMLTCHHAVVTKINNIVEQDKELTSIIKKYGMQSPYHRKLLAESLKEQYYNNNLFFHFRVTGLVLIVVGTIIMLLFTAQHIVDGAMYLVSVLYIIGAFLVGFQPFIGLSDMMQTYMLLVNLCIENHRYAKKIGIIDVMLPSFIHEIEPKTEVGNEEVKKIN